MAGFHMSRYTVCMDSWTFDVTLFFGEVSQRESFLWFGFVELSNTRTAGNAIVSG